MNIRKSLSLVVATALFASTAVFAGGTAGKDWDMKSFALTKANAAIITAQVTTTNTQSGNTSSIVLYVDGVEVDRIGGDRAEHTLTYRVTKKGEHVVKAVCSNTRADAETCTVRLAAEEVQIL